LALRGGVVIDGHDHDLPRGGTVVGGDGDPRRGDLGGADAHEAGPDELAKVAQGVETLGGIAVVVAEALVVGVQVDEPPVAIGVKVMVHDAAMKLIGIK
jgi:hypothetical protein